MAVSKPFFRDPQLARVLHQLAQQPLPTAADAGSATLAQPMSLMLPVLTALLFRPPEMDSSLWLTLEIANAAAQAEAATRAQAKDFT